MRAIVQGEAGQPWIEVAGTRISLDPSLGIERGQAVRVEIGANGQALRVTLAAPQTESQPEGAAQLTALVGRVLESLGAVQSPEMAARLLPMNLPHATVPVRLLLALFATRGSLSDDLQHVMTLVRNAVAAGVLSDGWLLDLFLPPATEAETAYDGPNSMLRLWAGQAGRSLESRFVATLASGHGQGLLEQVMEDLRGRLSLLRNDAGFQRFIQAADESSGFDRAVSHILERTSGAQLQNLRAFEQAYLFFEIPFASGSPIHHAQIHIFGDPQGKRGGFDANQAAIAMDLSTTHLGDLWVNLSLIRRYCTCAFRACAPQVVAAIEAHGAELTQALTRVGYRGASVYASLWDGNRLQAVAELMQRFAALDARA